MTHVLISLPAAYYVGDGRMKQAQAKPTALQHATGTRKALQAIIPTLDASRSAHCVVEVLPMAMAQARYTLTTVSAGSQVRCFCGWHGELVVSDCRPVCPRCARYLDTQTETQ